MCHECGAGRRGDHWRNDRHQPRRKGLALLDAVSGEHQVGDRDARGETGDRACTPHHAVGHNGGVESDEVTPE
jgi:hypothetical protein